MKHNEYVVEEIEEGADESAEQPELDLGVYLSVIYKGPWSEGGISSEVQVVVDYCGTLAFIPSRPSALLDPQELKEIAGEILAQDARYTEWEQIQKTVLGLEGVDDVDIAGADKQDLIIHRAEILEDGPGIYASGLDLGDFKLDAPGAAEYYAQLDAKHFQPNGTGSIFLQLKDHQQLLRLALLQGGFQDQREFFAGQGASADVMLSDRKYVLVRTPGLQGAFRAGDLPPNALITAHVSKGQVVDLLVDLPRTKTDIATLVMTQDNRLITTFPGIPQAPSATDLFPGQTVLAGELDPDATVLASSRYQAPG